MVMKVVNRYIGVEGGYLADFSYRTHAEFYPEYCDLDIDPNEFEGTTRERFMQILGSAAPIDQAKIIRGVIERFPVGGLGPATRTEELRRELLELASDLDRAPGVASPSPAITSEVVRRAIRDAELLVDGADATSAVDRMHTALHGYLNAACSSVGIVTTANPTMNQLLKLLREQHPSFKDLGVRQGEVERVLFASATILDALNPVRNQASVAHPNEMLLDEPEALLVINVVRSLLTYIDAKLT
jgi:hypothetical protein